MRSSANPPRPLERKILSRRQLIRLARRLKRQGRRVILTNGCFDLLHVGHVTLLSRAKQLGEVLVVALNSDRSIRALKGPSRPIVPQRDRARVVAALASVDYVTIFGERTPLRLIAALKPDVLVKGADWKARVVGQELVERAGGRVVLLPLVTGRSTTRTVARLSAAVRAAG